MVITKKIYERINIKDTGTGQSLKKVRMYAHVGTAADAQLEKSGVGIDQYFSNLHLGTFSLFLSGLVKNFFYIKYVKPLLQIPGSRPTWKCLSTVCRDFSQ